MGMPDTILCKGLSSVSLDEFAYPCLLYAIRRVGLSYLPCDKLIKRRGIRYPLTSGELQIGDILVWRNKKASVVSDAVLHMSAHGQITTKVQLGVHFGVYEGDGFVSDATFDGESYFPRIRLRHLSECVPPNEVLRRADLLLAF